MPQQPKIMNTFDSLMQIVKDLIGPEGCPWDQKQSHQSLVPFLIEETYEFAEAIENHNSDHPISNHHLKDEMGDVLFQVALHSALAEQKKLFTHMDVLTHLNEKLVRRHPHVFGANKVKDASEVSILWEEIKKQEKLKQALNSDSESKSYSDSYSHSKLASHFDIPKDLPSLQRAYKIGVKSRKLKFDWDQPIDVEQKVREELDEVLAEISHLEKSTTEAEKESTMNSLQEEFGDLLFSIAQWARHFDIEPEQCLRMANKKFETRFDQMMKLVKEKKLDWESLNTEQKESLWKDVKRAKKEHT